MTPKQFVLKKYPEAELVKDGCESHFFDYAVYVGDWFVCEGPTPKTTWENAKLVIEREGPPDGDSSL